MTDLLDDERRVAALCEAIEADPTAFPHWWFEADDEGNGSAAPSTMSPVDALLEKVLPADRATLDAPAVARVLGISEYSARAAIKRGEIPALWFNTRYVVPIPALRRMLEEGTIKPPSVEAHDGGVRVVPGQRHLRSAGNQRKVAT